jgi:hypothetical protein
MKGPAKTGPFVLSPLSSHGKVQNIRGDECGERARGRNQPQPRGDVAVQGKKEPDLAKKRRTGRREHDDHADDGGHDSCPQPNDLHAIPSRW